MRSLVRSLWVVGTMLLAIGCAGEESRPPAVIHGSPPPEGTARSTATDAAPPALRIDVVGVVATDLEDPIAGRRVVLLDARGERRELLTDEGGGFGFGAVEAPYDLTVVAPVAGGATAVLLGLRRSDPYIELFERDGPTPGPQPQTVRVGVQGPSCGAPSCTVSVVTASASGAGWSSTTSRSEDGMLVVDVEHGWRGLSVAPNELITVHVLVSDPARLTFAHARIDGVAASPGDTTDIGVTSPSAIGATELVTFGANGGAGVLVDWRWSTEVSLDVADVRGFPFVAAPSATVETRLPLIPGATVRVNASASHPRGDGRDGFHRSAEAWSGASPISSGAAAVTVDVAPGPELVRPAAGGIFSRRGLGFEWRGLGIPALSTLSVADVARGALRFRVMTNQDEVPLARLSALGLPKLHLGDHLFDLSTSPRVGIDDVTSPDTHLRHKRVDPSRPAAATYLRVPFQVVR